MTDITVVGAGGEYMESVVVVEWHKRLGDAVAAGELVVTVETAKAATEIEAPASGILAEVRAEVGKEIEVGGVLGVIADSAAPAARPVEDRPAIRPSPAKAAEVPANPVPARSPPNGRVLASPLARRVAAQKNIDLSVLTASSVSGRIKLRDVEAYEKARPKDALRPGLDKSAALSAEALLHVTRRGAANGDTLVLLHGFGADSLSWQPLVAALGDSASLVLVDLPGHGRSPAPHGRSSVHSLAGMVADALRGQGLDDVHLVGHSLGGAVALALAESGAVGVRSLTLLAPAGLGPEIDGAFVQGYARATRADSLRPWLLKLFADASIVTPGFVSATLQARSGAAMRDAQSELADAIFPDGTQAAEFRGVLERLAVPRKVIWGEQDRIIPKRHAMDTGAAVALHFLPGIGHMPHVEDPMTVARLILQNVRSAS